jgi:hypothetical protein
MKKTLIIPLKLGYLLFVIYFVFIINGCDNRELGELYNWSAKIGGIDYDYKTYGKSYPGYNGGSAHATCNVSQNYYQISLAYDSLSPQIKMVLPSFDIGTYYVDQNSTPNNLDLRYGSSDSYNTSFPQCQVTIDITKTDTSGGFLEGKFSGVVGKVDVATGNFLYVDINNGKFKAYIQ